MGKGIVEGRSFFRFVKDVAMLNEMGLKWNADKTVIIKDE